ncbi:MAG: nucleotidyltransferase domain-containing protein [Ignavibacteriales bacterium]|nr:nucleotidyltransferase domain-containing protein [Ignavibacteriales bacterium]
MVSREIIKTIKLYLNEVAKKGISIKKAYLYGSHARGEATSDSDIDLLLVSPLFEERNDKLKAQLWLIAGDINYKIEPYAVGEKKFLEDDHSPLLETVRQEGIEISF